MIYVENEYVRTKFEECGDIFEIARKRGGCKEIADLVIGMDIETYNTEEDGWIYSIATCVEGKTAVFRYIEEWAAFMEYLKEIIEYKLRVYVFNLSYEYMYMGQYLHSQWKVKKSLFVGGKKPLKIEYENGIILQDAYRLFQKKLEGATKGLPHEKRPGDIDHTAYHSPGKMLSPREYDYIVRDVAGLYEAITELRLRHGWRVGEIPLTNTSIVLMEMNRSTSNDAEYKKIRNKLVLNKEMLGIAYRTMGGGDTHGSRFYRGKVVKGCNMVDIKSAHPGQQLRQLYPGGQPWIMRNVTRGGVESLRRRGYGWIGKAILVGVFVKEGNPDPAISMSKVTNGRGVGEVDNGRLLDGEIITLYMDSNDWIRIMEGYDIEEVFFEILVCFRLRRLPRAFRETVFKWFKVKEMGKGTSEYAFYKVCVNSIFGACALKGIREEYEIDYESLEVKKRSWEEHLKLSTEEEVRKSQWQRLPYLWGLWTSSLTRLQLWETIKAIGWSRVLYWDTDSVYYRGKKSGAVEEINKRHRDECEALGITIEREGKEPVFIGSLTDDYEEDEYGLEEFKFLHAKCYGYRTKDGVKYTIAGVNKAKAKEAMGDDLNNFHEGKYISDAGGQKLTYYLRTLEERQLDGVMTHTASYIYMQPRDYLIGPVFKEEAEIMIYGGFSYDD